MAGDEAYGDADRAALRELFRDMEHLERSLDRMSGELESVSEKLEPLAVLTSTVARNTDDIAGMRKSLDGKRITERIAVLEAYMKGANGDLSTSPRWWVAMVTGVGMLLLGALTALEWILELVAKLR